MIITAWQPGPGEANPLQHPGRRMIREKRLSGANVRLSLEMAISEAPPSRSPVGLARLCASADWATPGLGRHRVCELQCETRTLATFVYVWSPLRLCGHPRCRPCPLIGPGCWRRCTARLEILFIRKRAFSCARRIRRTSTSTPHLIGAVLKTNYVTLGALCLVRPGTSVLGRGLAPIFNGLMTR